MDNWLRDFFDSLPNDRSRMIALVFMLIGIIAFAGPMLIEILLCCRNQP